MCIYIYMYKQIYMYVLKYAINRQVWKRAHHTKALLLISYFLAKRCISEMNPIFDMFLISMGLFRAIIYIERAILSHES